MKENKLHVLICGGRHFDNYSIFNSIIDTILEDNFSDATSIEIVSGGASGVDSMAERYAKENNIPIKVFPANWSELGRAAGPIRNQKMVSYINRFPNKAVIGFTSNNTVGTKGTINLAKKLNIPVIEIPYSLNDISVDLYEGIRFDGNDYQIDWKNNTDEDVVKFNSCCVSFTRFNKRIRYFGYKINKESDKQDRNNFMSYLKSTSDRLRNELIDRSIEDLYERSEVKHFDYIIKIPSISTINDEICNTIINHYDNSRVIEPTKKPVAELEFNWDKFLTKFKGDAEYLSKFKKYINNFISSLKKNSSFSITKIPPQYRPYIVNMINFDGYRIINNENINILIVDDIFTTGSSVSMILNYLDNLDFKGNLFIYTLINNR